MERPKPLEQRDAWNCALRREKRPMNCTINTRFGTAPQTDRPPHCNREQTRELLEVLLAAYQSLVPFERIVFRGIITQAARTQFRQEMNEEVPDTINVS